MSCASEETQGQSDEMQQDALAPGETLLRGQYRIESYLASGGFGITYLALDSLDRKVVIKECFPNAFCCRSGKSVKVRSAAKATDFETVVRHFAREARRLARLSHPNIVGVHQVFADNGTAYMALDFVDGRDLMNIVENDRDRFSPEAIKEMLVKLLEAIGYIHDHNMIHRDISPDNILVDKTGNPVLIDFGASHEVATTKSRALSALHVVKDGYSPQEAYLDNLGQTKASDIYSLAATFYHLITGAAPVNSQKRVAALASNRPDPYVPLPPIGSGFDHFFHTAMDKALAVFPEDRPQTAGEFIDMIEEKRRCEALRAQALRDQKVDLAIRRLTEETNRAIARMQAIEMTEGSYADSLPKDGDAASKPAAPRNGEEGALETGGNEPNPTRSLLGWVLSRPRALWRSRGAIVTQAGKSGP